MTMTDGTINITYGVAGNAYGWTPVTRNNGRLVRPYVDCGYDKDVALRLAKENALAEADHYCGDWTINVTEETT